MNERAMGGKDGRLTQATKYLQDEALDGLIAVSNGLKHYYCRIDFDASNYKFIGELPDYGEM